jgi:CRISPR-associated RAMP protein (TIGR02581 family)
MFNKLTNRLELTGTLQLVTALRIGAGRALEPGATDLPVIKDAFGRPYIPGSSFKGVLRSYAESLLRAAAPDEDTARRLACNPLSESKAQGGRTSKFRRCIAPDEMQELKQAAADIPDFDDYLLERTCLACRFFGAQWIASPLQIRDLLIEPQFLYRSRYTRYEVRNGVAINRDTETAGNALLYDFEVVPAGINFQFKALVDSASEHQLGLLFLALRAFERGHRGIGGASSRGLGDVRLHWTGQYVDFVQLVEGQSSAEQKLDAIFNFLSETQEAEQELLKPGDSRIEGWVKSLRTEIARVLAASEEE